MTGQKRCAASLSPSFQELGVLEAIDRPVDELQTTYRCELQGGHLGTHFALGQTNDAGQDWWLSWDPAVVPLPACQSSSTGSPGGCLLPDAHAGGHSFDLASRSA